MLGLGFGLGCAEDVAEGEGDEEVGDGKEALSGAVEPVDVGEGGVVVHFGVDARGDGGEHKDEQESKGKDDLLGHASLLGVLGPRLVQCPQESKVREQAGRKQLRP